MGVFGSGYIVVRGIWIMSLTKFCDFFLHVIITTIITILLLLLFKLGGLYVEFVFGFYVSSTKSYNRHMSKARSPVVTATSVRLSSHVTLMLSVKDIRVKPRVTVITWSPLGHSVHWTFITLQSTGLLTPPFNDVTALSLTFMLLEEDGKKERNGGRKERERESERRGRITLSWVPLSCWSAWERNEPGFTSHQSQHTAYVWAHTWECCLTGLTGRGQLLKGEN